jgi:lysophospholipase L1-like esterase
MFHRHRKLLFSTIACVIGLVMIEGSCSLLWLLLDFRWFASAERITPRRADVLMPGENLEVYHSQYDEELGWIHIPGRTIADFYGPGLDMTINNDGLRGDADYIGKKSNDTYRVVCLGDSMTMGYGIDDDDTYPARLQLINQRIQVVNMGMGGYSTCQCGLWYRRIHADLEADLLIFSIIAEDVFRVDYNSPKFQIVNGRVEVVNVPVPRNFRTGELEIESIRFSNFLVDHSATARTINSMVSRKPADQTTAVQDPLDLTIAMIVELARLTEKANQGFVVVLLPDSDEVPGHQNFNFEEQRTLWIVAKKIEATTSQLGVPYLSLLASFAAHDSKELSGLYLREVYNHFSPAGNELVAESIDSWLADQIPRYPRRQQ